jgi:dedicator of cytokinesis protein 3
MNNVNKELHDLIAQYRGDAKRNINPFSMRLQGIIDANVMGGISKYQEAFFTDEFAKAEGKGQSANVQKLKCLILEQMKILDIALELHGNLAPSGVQPLHKRLKERYAQLKQNSEGLGRLKRQHSESIVNTPLPPIPLSNENRTHSLGHQSQSEVLYEKDEIYTHLSGSISLEREPTGNRETLLLPEIANVSEILVAPSIVPPIPTRPKSAGHISLTDSPEVPPKTGSSRDKNAPPLPPRGLTNEKRASGTTGSGEFDQMIPSIPARRSHKYSVVDISIEGSFGIDSDLNRSDEILNDYRDSGSGHELGNLNNLNLFDECIVRGHLKTNSNPEILNILTNDPGQIDFSMEKHSYELPSPPPIPPK